MASLLIVLSPMILLLPFLIALSVTGSQPPVLPPPPMSESLLNVTESLARLGYHNMSLIVQLVGPLLYLRPQIAAFLTIFSPPDSSFSSHGYPSIGHLLQYFSDIYLSPRVLFTLPFGSEIPSLSPSDHPIVTSNSTRKFSIYNVGVSDSPIYDDRAIIVYRIDDLYPLNFTLPDTEPDSNCLKVESTSKFGDASDFLSPRGYSKMASFLESQILGFQGTSIESMKWTVFAPLDTELAPFSRNFLGYNSVFLRHLVPCRVRWVDLVQLTNRTVFSNTLMGSALQISRDENNTNTKVNGVEVIFPDMYANEWLVIHGIGGVIPLPDN